MKKQISVLLGSIMLTGSILTGCGNEKTSTENKEKATSAEQKDVSNKSEKEEKGTVNLSKVGQKAKADGNEAELMKIKEVNQTVDIAPIKYTVKDMKIIKLNKVNKSMTEFLLQYTGGNKLPDDLNYIQIQYSVENTSDQNVDFYGLQKVVLNNGEQLDAIGNDFIWESEDSDSKFYGKVKKEGSVGLIIKGKPEEITSAKLIFSNTVNPDGYETITEEQQAEFQF
ncbi:MULTISPECIES: hypothetical protein [Bacillus]|uniref:Lipoprotein n=2 Tax=Bacillus cereus group TaxID=86661 RepID=A0A2A7D7U0_BACAN|nr:MULTISPECIES: hypothetical protein [Bacillus]ADY22292.1 hypothetical protein YBT020_15310 [Bacillus thuringiensis serovar finitimus YBT-020]MRC71060.1 hypothetical protein [Bacillus thuringiensis]OTX69742.1 hypothetical protein BK722_15185 [Bacillus thuringiensis serovar finitimus]MBG9907571.1 hypothetical protein [Bacillus paranthracis]MCP1164218.1 hypothetical protein [Bacillus sp. 1813sda1]